MEILDAEAEVELINNRKCPSALTLPISMEGKVLRVCHFSVWEVITECDARIGEAGASWQLVSVVA